VSCVISTEDIVFSEPREDVRVTLPDGTVLSGPVGATLESFVNVWQERNGEPNIPITAALVDGQVRELSHRLEKDAAVIPLDISTVEGMRTYKRSLTMVLVAAAQRLFPNTHITIDHSITANGYYCETEGRPPLSPQEVTTLEREMRQLVQADLPLSRQVVSLGEATAIFARQGYDDKVRLLRFHRMPTVELCELAGAIAPLFGEVVPHTGYLQRFRLVHRDDGFMLLFPLMEDPHRFPEDTNFPKLIQQFRESSEWLARIRARDAGSLNAFVERGFLRELVLVAEALHERKIADIADQIADRPAVRIVIIAGPSSSGKTTFAKRLGIQLSAIGLRSFAISLDDYFVSRELTPRDESGEYDFESFEAVDHALFNDHMTRLLAGERVQLPRYDFTEGTRMKGPSVSLPKGTVLLVEGLHGLNPALLPGVSRERLYKVYVSCLTQLNIDHHNYVATSDSRLLRRIVRDAHSRGYTPEETILRWRSVRRGEHRYIFPFQENSDVMFNSALPYELSVLKPLAEPLLATVPVDSAASREVQRLRSLLRFFLPAELDLVPDNSLLREFTGGSIMEQVALAGFPHP